MRAAALSRCALAGHKLLPNPRQRGVHGPNDHAPKHQRRDREFGLDVRRFDSRRRDDLLLLRDGDLYRRRFGLSPIGIFHDDDPGSRSCPCSLNFRKIWTHGDAGEYSCSGARERDAFARRGPEHFGQLQADRRSGDHQKVKITWKGNGPMSWKRGSASAEVELSRVQDWIEYVDPDLYGPDGDDGMIREFRDDKAAAMQRSKDIGTLLKLGQWVLTPSLIGLVIMSILRALHVIT